MRRTLRNNIIATVGHTPMWIGEIVRRCGGHRASDQKWSRVRSELQRLVLRGLIARLNGRTFVASEGLRKR